MSVQKELKLPVLEDAIDSVIKFYYERGRKPSYDEFSERVFRFLYITFSQNKDLAFSELGSDALGINGKSKIKKRPEVNEAYRHNKWE